MQEKVCGKLPEAFTEGIDAAEATWELMSGGKVVVVQCETACGKTTRP